MTPTEFRATLETRRETMYEVIEKSPATSARNTFDTWEDASEWFQVRRAEARRSESPVTELQLIDKSEGEDDLVYCWRRS